MHTIARIYLALYICLWYCISQGMAYSRCHLIALSVVAVGAVVVLLVTHYNKEKITK